MKRNIEIKAHARDFDAQVDKAERIASGPAQLITQEDTFFHVSNGRLKLREFGDGTGELIQYHRADAAGPKQSSYVLSRTTEPETLKAALANALGVRAVVKKTRTLYLSGQTRLHFDEVENLGRFIELEVVLDAEQDAGEGTPIAEKLMAALGIQEGDLITGAYVDMLLDKR